MSGTRRGAPVLLVALGLLGAVAVAAGAGTSGGGGGGAPPVGLGPRRRSSASSSCSWSVGGVLLAVLLVLRPQELVDPRQDGKATGGRKGARRGRDRRWCCSQSSPSGASCTGDGSGLARASRPLADRGPGDVGHRPLRAAVRHLAGGRDHRAAARRALRLAARRAGATERAPGGAGRSRRRSRPRSTTASTTCARARPAACRDRSVRAPRAGARRARRPAPRRRRRPRSTCGACSPRSTSRRRRSRA